LLEGRVTERGEGASQSPLKAVPRQMDEKGFSGALTEPIGRENLKLCADAV